MSSRISRSSAIHPSFLALDRAHLGTAEPALLEHVSGCDECRLYLASLKDAALEPAPAALRHAIGSRPDFIEPRKLVRLGRPWLWGAASLAALVCSLVLWVGQRPSSELKNDETYVGAKGFRSVWVYVKHGDETRLWDGKQPFTSGDRVRLKIDPGAYHRVQVYSATAPDTPKLIYSVALTPGQILTLPEAWEIDSSTEAERLFVVFSSTLAEPTPEDWQRAKLPAKIAVVPLILPKARAGSDAGSH